MNPTPGSIIVSNLTTANDLAFNVGGPNGEPNLASGVVNSQGSYPPIAVSGYEEYQVTFFPLGQPESEATVNVTVDAEEPTKVSFAQSIT